MQQLKTTLPHCPPGNSNSNYGSRNSIPGLGLLAALIGILGLTFTAHSQKIYSVDYANQADVKVYVVDYENQCDLKVYKVNYANQADGNRGLWYFVDYPNQADKKIYFVDYQNQADLKIYFVEYQNQAGWRNKSKQAVMY